ncbi:MAG: hypothetical protein ACRC8Y_16800 [Chroococcales cyanobacterium]
MGNGNTYTLSIYNGKDKAVFPEVWRRMGGDVRSNDFSRSILFGVTTSVVSSCSE